MKRRATCVIEKFNAREADNKQSVFQLTRDSDGMYQIKRGSDKLLSLQEEDKARKGFNRLRERWAVEKQPR